MVIDGYFSLGTLFILQQGEHKNRLDAVHTYAILSITHGEYPTKVIRIETSFGAKQANPTPVLRDGNETSRQSPFI